MEIPGKKVVFPPAHMQVQRRFWTSWLPLPEVSNTTMLSCLQNRTKISHVTEDLEIALSCACSQNRDCRKQGPGIYTRGKGTTQDAPCNGIFSNSDNQSIDEHYQNAPLAFKLALVTSVPTGTWEPTSWPISIAQVETHLNTFRIVPISVDRSTTSWRSIT